MVGRPDKQHTTNNKQRAGVQLPPRIPSATIRAMRWLLHGPMTPAVADALRRHGHALPEDAAIPVDPPAPVAEVLKTAKARQLDILTTDPSLAAAPFELDYWFDRSIVFLQLEGGDIEQDDAVDRLFARYKRLTPGRLYTVTASRVKVRQLPGKKQ